MKKVLIGCGVVVILIIVVIALGVTWAVRAGMKIAEQMKAGAERVEATNQKFPFTGPADGLMIEERLVAWINLHKQAGEKAKQFNLSSEIIESKAKSNRLGLIKEMMESMPNMMLSQVEALEQAHMSQKEYAWITGQVMGTLSSGDMHNDPSAAKMIKAVEAQVDTPPGMTNQHRGSNLPQALAAPVTTAQIKHVFGLLKKHEPDFLVAAPGIGFMDTMISSFGNRNQRFQQPNPSTSPAPVGSPIPTVSPAPQPAH